MINFEDIIDYLALKGVKSLHIEMQEQQLTDEERARLTYRLPRHEVKPPTDNALIQMCKCVGKHDDVVHRGEPGAGEPIVVPTPAKAATVPPVETKAVEPKPTPVPEKPAEPVVEKKAVAEPAKKVVADTSAKSSAKPPYEAFCDMISADDGKVTAEERVALINLMGLDDLLRVNNDFQLGLDTDKPVDDVRADVIECFK